jgi:hypothetical protein
MLLKNYFNVELIMEIDNPHIKFGFVKAERIEGYFSAFVLEPPGITAAHQCDKGRTAYWKYILGIF